MTEIAYRPYRQQDAEDVKEIIDEAFYIHRYVSQPRLLNSALEVYLRECLLISSHTRVAVQEGRVIGVLMGQVSGEPRLRGALGNGLLIAGHALKLAALGFRERRSLRQYSAIHGVYRSLHGSTTSPLTDELTLFAVTSSARGLGVGKALYQDYLKHLRRRGRTDFYLYTDSLCSYGFYEKQGMTRAASQDMTVYLDGEPEVLGVYLYTGTAA